MGKKDNRDLEKRLYHMQVDIMVDKANGVRCRYSKLTTEESIYACSLFRYRLGIHHPTVKCSEQGARIAIYNGHSYHRCNQKPKDKIEV